eukprot:scaffold8266_cov175-Amphora_coffeaeformis.AAC.4
MGKSKRHKAFPNKMSKKVETDDDAAAAAAAAAATAADDRREEEEESSKKLKVDASEPSTGSNPSAIVDKAEAEAEAATSNSSAVDDDDDDDDDDKQQKNHPTSPRNSPAPTKDSPDKESSSENKSLLTPIMSQTTISDNNESLSPLCHQQPQRNNKTLDLESALYKMTLLSPKEHDKKEYLIEPCCCIPEERDDSVGSKPSPALWVNFRLAHTGDAATLAALYCKQQQPTSNPNEEQIALWLADGLGDEDTPPSVYGLLCEVHQEDEKGSHQIGAAVLLTAAWQEDLQRVIRIEWYRIQPEYRKLEGHLFLRLAALALWTDSALVWVQPPPPPPLGNNHKNNVSLAKSPSPAAASANSTTTQRKTTTTATPRT